MIICLIYNNRALSLFHHKTSPVEAAPLAAGGVPVMVSNSLQTVEVGKVTRDARSISSPYRGHLVDQESNERYVGRGVKCMEGDFSSQKVFQSSVFAHAGMIGMTLWHSCIP